MSSIDNLMQFQEISEIFNKIKKKQFEFQHKQIYYQELMNQVKKQIKMYSNEQCLNIIIDDDEQSFESIEHLRNGKKTTKVQLQKSESFC